MRSGRVLLSRLPVVGRIFLPCPVLLGQLRVILASKPRDPGLEAWEAWVQDLSARLALEPDDVEFLISAIGSYRLRSGVLKGVPGSYGKDHRAVFHALDHLAAE